MAPVIRPTWSPVMTDSVSSSPLTSTLCRAIQRRRASAASTSQTTSTAKAITPLLRCSAAARPMTGR
jgi:hypothetical protein